MCYRNTKKHLAYVQLTKSIRNVIYSIMTFVVMEYITFLIDFFFFFISSTIRGE